MLTAVHLHDERETEHAWSRHHNPWGDHLQEDFDFGQVSIFWGFHIVNTIIKSFKRKIFFF